MKKFSFLSAFFVLCMLAVPFQTFADDFVRGDCNLDGSVSIGDVTCLIDYLLTNQWPEDAEPEMVTFVVNGIEINMVRVEGGTFTMGASGADLDAQDDEFPAHIVTLSTFYICTTEVTQQLWRAVMGSNPSSNVNPLYPVESVAWNECSRFITKLNQMTGQNFRLPTEAEWEFAARGGNKSKGFKYAGSNDVNEVAWYYDNSSNQTHQVATKAPNELGLFDMSGNVYEWCSDWYGSYSNTNAQTNPQGPSSGTYKVRRGGGFYWPAEYCRVSSRHKLETTFMFNDSGLRLAMSCE